MIDRFPALIAHYRDDSDVTQAVNFGRSRNPLVALSGGGHSVAGFGTCDDGLVIDLSPMKKNTADLKAGAVQAQAGLTWGDCARRSKDTRNRRNEETYGFSVRPNKNIEPLGECGSL